MGAQPALPRQAFSAVPQAGQREPGRAIETPSGMRWMQTLRKLPQMAPQTKAKA